MTESIDDLYARWQRNPDAAETTVALCEALRGSRRPDLVDIVGSHVSRQLEIAPLLAAARMYTDTGRLEDAQSVLLSAGRLAPRDGDVYRWLGEVLLRRGDAERAEKVLEKALQFNAGNGAGALLERARALVPTQRTNGPAAVAKAVSESNSPHLLRGGVKNRIVPAESDEDVETQIRKNNDIRAAMEAALAPISSPMIPAAGRPAPLPRSTPPPPMAMPPPSARPPPMRMPPMPPADDLIFTTPTRGLGFDLQAAPPKPQTRDNDVFAARGSQPLTMDDLQSDSDPFPSSGKAAVSAASTAAFGSAVRREAPAPPPPPQYSPPQYQPPQQRPPEPPVDPKLFDVLARPAAPKGAVSLGGAAIPEPRDVLDALQIAGVYEPDGAVKPAVYTWNQPENKVSRLFSTITLVGLALLLVGGGIGGYFYVTDKRAKAHLEAEAMLAKVDHDIALGDGKLLEPSEKALSRAFELESRSKHAALTWLHERAMVGLVKGGADLAFEDATQRAKEVGVDDKQTSFAHVASFLFQGDIAGAASTVAKYDAIAQQDAYFQLLAGATFERAGDQRALERYNAAVKLDPELIIAQILLTRAAAVDGDPRRAAELAKEFRIRYPDRVEGAALIALTWTRDPLRGEPPPEMKDVTEKADVLPVPLKAIPHASRALLALYKGNVDEAKPSLQKGLEVADTPGIAAWLGSIALATGDENLARKAALTAVSFSAVYPPARVLAARVALLAARLDEALKATEDLPPTSPDVAIVTAAASYEKLDGERMSRAFESVPEETKKLPFVLPLVRGQSILAGNLSVINADKAFDMADDDAPWADLVAMDFALDGGDLELAKKIAERWHGEPRPMRAVRLARLARYDGKLEEADKLSKSALEGAAPTMRVLAERVFTLVALKKDTDALAVIKQYPNVGGPLQKWLKAYATASHGKIEEARAMVAQEDPPSSASPLPSRIIAAAAYGAMKDVRHGGEFVKPIVATGVANPDIAQAVEKLGLGKVTFRRR